MLNLSPRTLLCVLLILIGSSLSGSPTHAAQEQPALDPIVRVVDLNVGETTTVTLSNGEQVKVKLCDLKETRDPIRNAVRSAIVTVEVDGDTIELESGMYNLPVGMGLVGNLLRA